MITLIFLGSAAFLAFIAAIGLFNIKSKIEGNIYCAKNRIDIEAYESAQEKSFKLLLINITGSVVGLLLMYGLIGWFFDWSESVTLDDGAVFYVFVKCLSFACFIMILTIPFVFASSMRNTIKCYRDFKLGISRRAPKVIENK